MIDSVTPEQRSRVMARVKSKDTRPELTVRKLLHAHGFRYRLHDSKLPGRPDIVFASRRKIIFVNGCFWHKHGCSLARTPKSNVAFWASKLEANRVRDTKNLGDLKSVGWDVLVIWECELRDLGNLTGKILDFLK